MADTVLETEELEEQAAAGESSEEESPAADYGENGEKLPELLQQELKNLCHKFDARDQWARQIELLRTTLLRFFWLGLQHTWWDADAGMYQVGPSGGMVTLQENLNEEPTFRQDFNIFTSYGKSFISVFGQNSPATRMEPDEALDSRSIEAAEEAQKYTRIYEKFNPPKVQQIEIGRILWTDGRLVSLTRTIADKSRFGVDKDGKPRQREITYYFGVLETKVPIYESDFAKWPYCKISGDHDLCYLKEKYSEFAANIAIGSKSSSPNEEIARMSRIATSENVTQLSQDTLKYLVTEDQWWLRPAAFRECPDDTRKQLLELFPDGVQVTFCGDTYVGAKNESMDAHLNVMHALPGTGQSRPSLGDAEVPIQMEFNDAMNLAAECFKYAIPSIWADMDDVTVRALMEQKAQYGAIRPLKLTRGAGEPVENLFYAEPTVQPPELFATWIENLQGPLSQFITGQQPALFGGNMEDQKTARGYSQARDQALGLMAIVWIPFKEFYAKICEQAAVQAAQREVDKLTAIVPAKGGKKTDTVSVDVAKMRGGFLCSPVSDENFPESWTQKSNKIMQMVQAAPENPVLAKFLMQPDNLVLLRDMGIGIEEFVIADADARDLQLAEWAEMQENGSLGPLEDNDLTAAPEEEAEIPQSEAQPTGQPTPQPGTGPEIDEQATQQKEQKAQMLMQQTGIQPPGPVPPVLRSSVPIDLDTDNHAVHAEECLRILNSAEGQKVKKASPGVWLDLKLHYLAHKQAIAAMAPPPVIPPMPVKKPGMIPPPPVPPLAAAGAPA